MSVSVRTARPRGTEAREARTLPPGGDGPGGAGAAVRSLCLLPAWCLVSSAGSGRTTSGQGGELREVLGT